MIQREPHAAANPCFFGCCSQSVRTLLQTDALPGCGTEVLRGTSVLDKLVH